MPFRMLGFNHKAIPMSYQFAETWFSSFFTSKRASKPEGTVRQNISEMTTSKNVFTYNTIS